MGRMEKIPYMNGWFLWWIRREIYHAWMPWVQMHPTKKHDGLHELFHGIWVFCILPDDEFGVKEACCHLETCSPHFSTTTPTHVATESAIPKLKKKKRHRISALGKRSSCSWNRNWWRWCWSHFRQKQEFPSVSRIHCWSDKTWNINKHWSGVGATFFWGASNSTTQIHVKTWLILLILVEVKIKF